MKKILFVLLLVACSEDEPEISGSWAFETEQFSGVFSVDDDGVGNGFFYVNGKQYFAVNSQIVQGSSIVMYSEDGAYLGLHELDFPTSRHQEYREGGLPSPYQNQVRNSILTLSRTP